MPLAAPLLLRRSLLRTRVPGSCKGQSREVVNSDDGCEMGLGLGQRRRPRRLPAARQQQRGAEGGHSRADGGRARVLGAAGGGGAAGGARHALPRHARVRPGRPRPVLPLGGRPLPVHLVRPGLQIHRFTYSPPDMHKRGQSHHSQSCHWKGGRCPSDAWPRPFLTPRYARVAPTPSPGSLCILQRTARGRCPACPCLTMDDVVHRSGIQPHRVSCFGLTCSCLAWCRGKPRRWADFTSVLEMVGLHFVLHACRLFPMANVI